MSILCECPICRNRQKVSNKICKCGENLDRAKRSTRVKYWISYRLPNRKQRREVVGYRIDDARAAEGKRRAQKKEQPRVLELLAIEKITFQELTDWYLGLSSVKKLASYQRIKDALQNYNKALGQTRINDLTLNDLEEYQLKREEQGKAPATIDMELTIAKTMVTKAFDNDKIGGDALRPFRRVRRRLKKGSNARQRTLKFDEYLRLVLVSPEHLRPIIILGFYTGMRIGEILNLKRAQVDRKSGFIRLGDQDTKEGRKKSIPINRHVEEVLDQIISHVNHDYIFTYRHKPVTKIRKAFRIACVTADIPYGSKVQNGIIFHDIRRTVKTNMLNSGVDKIYRDCILGHSLQGMDAYYMAPSEEDLRKAMRKYTNWVDEQLTKIENVDLFVDQR